MDKIIKCDSCGKLLDGETQPPCILVTKLWSTKGFVLNFCDNAGFCMGKWEREHPLVRLREATTILSTTIYNKETDKIEVVCGKCNTIDNHWSEVGPNLWCNICSRYIIENGEWIFRG